MDPRTPDEGGDTQRSPKGLLAQLHARLFSVEGAWTMVVTAISNAIVGGFFYLVGWIRRLDAILVILIVVNLIAAGYFASNPSRLTALRRRVRTIWRRVQSGIERSDDEPPEPPTKSRPSEPRGPIGFRERIISALPMLVVAAVIAVAASVAGFMAGARSRDDGELATPPPAVSESPDSLTPTATPSPSPSSLVAHDWRGDQVDDVVAELEALGVHVEAVPVEARQPEGEVVDQDPPPESLIGPSGVTLSFVDNPEKTLLTKCCTRGFEESGALFCGAWNGGSVPLGKREFQHSVQWGQGIEGQDHCYKRPTITVVVPPGVVRVTAVAGIANYAYVSSAHSAHLVVKAGNRTAYDVTVSAENPLRVDLDVSRASRVTFVFSGLNDEEEDYLPVAVAGVVGFHEE